MLDCGETIDFILPEIFETDFKNLNLFKLMGEIKINGFKDYFMSILVKCKLGNRKERLGFTLHDCSIKYKTFLREFVLSENLPCLIKPLWK